MPKLMLDASQPPATWPAAGAFAGYIGGDTPHVWTLAEWQHLGKQPKLPIWVQSHPSSTVAGQDEALHALARLYDIGCPRGSTVALDMETAADPAYTNGFHDVMRWAGFYVWVYGSRSTVFGNPPCDGYWVADYTGTPHFPAGNAVRACQYQAGPDVDRSVVRWWQWRNRLWR